MKEPDIIGSFYILHRATRFYSGREVLISVLSTLARMPQESVS